MLRRHRGNYTADELALLEELAQRAAMALDNAQLYQDAQEALREREAFLLIASHEVKNPLTTLLGRSQMLRRRLERKADGARELEDIDIIIDQSKRINRLLSELLDASRLESGQFMLQPTPFDLGALIQRVVSEIRPSAPAHTITYAERAERLTIAGDASRLEQVFRNLIGNAVKYSPAGGTIAIEVGIDGSRARHTQRPRPGHRARGAATLVQAILSRRALFHAVHLRDGHWPVCGQRDCERPRRNC
jgi:signal transduction histidine kinase